MSPIIEIILINIMGLLFIGVFVAIISAGVIYAISQYLFRIEILLPKILYTYKEGISGTITIQTKRIFFIKHVRVRLEKRIKNQSRKKSHSHTEIIQSIDIPFSETITPDNPQTLSFSLLPFSERKESYLKDTFLPKDGIIGATLGYIQNQILPEYHIVVSPKSGWWMPQQSIRVFFEDTEHVATPNNI